MGRLALFLVGSAMIAMTIGCSDESSGGGGSAGTGGSGGTAGMGGTAGTGGAAGMGGSGMVQLSVSVTDAPSIDSELFNGPSLEGVELCETDTTNCATTDAGGAASIMLPANQEVSYTVSKDGYGPYLVGDVTDGLPLTSTWPMISDALLAVDGERLMIPYPWTAEGVISLGAFPLREGVTYDLIDETATQSYTDEGGVVTLDLTATTSTGRGGFFEVAPGEHQIEFGGTATNCAPGIAWPGDAASRIRVPVRAGHLSYGSMNCEEP